MDKKILILLPIWGRKKITKICLDNLKDLQSSYNIEVLCVVSEQWAKLEAFRYGFKWVVASNDCLGTKMNIGVKKSLEYKYDYLMNLGSDDIITRDLFKRYETFFNNEYPFFGSTRLTFIDSESKEARTKDYKITIGAGRCIKRSEIEEVLKRGDMYPKKQKGLDLASMAKFDCPIREIENDFNTIFDIKSDTNIWSFEEMTKAKNRVSLDECKLSDSQLDAILDL